MLTLEGFDPKKVERMTSLVKENFKKDYSKDLFFEMASLFPDKYLTVIDGDVLVGFLMGALTSPKEARILIFVVDKEHRNMGVGTKMLSTFVDRCRAKGTKRIRLEVKTTNEDAIRLYKKFGFKAVRILPRYYRDHSNGYMMYLDLS